MKERQKRKKERRKRKNRNEQAIKINEVKEMENKKK